jgi:hypothetical protein
MESFVFQHLVTPLMRDTRAAASQQSDVSPPRESIKPASISTL